MAEREQPARRGQKREDRPEEFERFEDLTRKLVRVPKSAVNGKPRAKPSRSARRK